MQLLLSGSVPSLFLQVLPVSLLVGLLFTFLRIRQQKKRGLPIRQCRELLLFLFVCYVAGLVNLVLVPPNFWGDTWYRLLVAGFSGWTPPRLFSGDFQFVPTFVRYLTGELAGPPGAWISTMLICNFLMLVPMGVFLPVLFPGLRGRRMLVAAAVIPSAIELLQPVIGRSFDTDDLITNFLGILVGWGLVKLLQAMPKPRSPH